MKISNVLVVEDSDGDQALIARQLQKESLGNSLSFAKSLKEAWKMIGNMSYDLLLVDINLPDGTGLDFCTELRNQGLRIPVIFMSGISDACAIATAKQAGVNQFLVKPFSFESLHFAIKRLDQFWMTITHDANENTQSRKNTSYQQGREQC